jgi:hypothetical protein
VWLLSTLRVLCGSLRLGSNHALHRTLSQRRFACWFRAGEGSRYRAKKSLAVLSG